MKKIALIYWPKKGSTEQAAMKIAAAFDSGMVDVFTITSVDVGKLESYDALIIGGSTVGADNWEQAHKTRWADFFTSLEGISLKGKPFAIFGLGDQVLYPYHFVDGMAEIRKWFEKAGGQHKGLWPTEGYDFRDSKSVVNGRFLGLALDFEQQKDLNDGRVSRWAAQLKKEFGF